METVSFTEENFKDFKARYKKAVEKKEESFVFLGNEYVTGFAKYLIEYIENK